MGTFSWKAFEKPRFLPEKADHQTVSGTAKTAGGWELAGGRHCWLISPQWHSATTENGLAHITALNRGIPNCSTLDFSTPGNKQTSHFVSSCSTPARWGVDGGTVGHRREGATTVELVKTGQKNPVSVLPFPKA